MKTAVIIVAAGKGSRFGGNIPKQFLRLRDLPVLSHSLKKFLDHNSVSLIQPVINHDHKKFYLESLNSLKELKNSKKILSPCLGGAERSLSVKSGLIALLNHGKNLDNVLIHDAARRLVSKKIIDEVLNHLSNFEAVFPTLPMVDSVWKVKNNMYQLIKDRQSLIRAQTPQGFRFSSILDAHLANKESWGFDDIYLANKLGISIQQIPGCETNLKITTIDDLARAERLIT